MVLLKRCHIEGSIVNWYWQQRSEFHIVLVGTANIFRTSSLVGIETHQFRSGINTDNTGVVSAIPGKLPNFGWLIDTSLVLTYNTKMDLSLMHSLSLFSLKPTASHWILSGDGRRHKQQNELRIKTIKLREMRQNWKLKRQN